jgi:hypothetical protein
VVHAFSVQPSQLSCCCGRGCRRVANRWHHITPSTAAVSVQALLHPDERSAWLDDVASPGCGADVPLNTATLSQADRTAAHLSPLLLFSLNDYLGLSTHPDVRAAAAAAAAQVCGCDCM